MWLRAARQGDAEAFAELYRRYLGRVREYCARRVGSPLRAEDLAQDTFLKAFEGIASFRPGAAFWPWLSTIARNLCIDELRQRGRSVEEVTSQVSERFERTIDLDPTPEELLSEDTQWRIAVALNAAMGELSDRDRDIVWNHAVDQLTWGQIASRNRTSLDAARNAGWRARGILRAKLSESLRDLRTWLVFPLATFADRLRARLRRLNTQANCQWLCAGGLVSERIAELVVATALLGGSLLIGSHAATALATAGANMSSPSKPTQHQADSIETQANSRLQGRLSLEMKRGPAVARVRIQRRPGAAAPSSTFYSLEIRTMSGQSLYWRRTTIKCGDGQASHLVPQISPVRAYC